jgi:cellobiose-specific phosphotransferase system component IIB
MRIVLALDTIEDIRLIGGRLADAARERGEPVDIVPAPEGLIPEDEWERADLVLLGQQTKAMLPAMQQPSAFNHVPVAVIPTQDIAIADGRSILEQAMAVVHNQDYHREAGQDFHPR